jgi:hypothetical protein
VTSEQGLVLGVSSTDDFLHRTWRDGRGGAAAQGRCASSRVGLFLEASEPVRLAYEGGALEQLSLFFRRPTFLGFDGLLLRQELAGFCDPGSLGRLSRLVLRRALERGSLRRHSSTLRLGSEALFLFATAQFFVAGGALERLEALGLFGLLTRFLLGAALERDEPLFFFETFALFFGATCLLCDACCLPPFLGEACFFVQSCSLGHLTLLVVDARGFGLPLLLRETFLFSQSCRFGSLTFFFGNSRDLGQSHGLSGLTLFFGGACCFGQPGGLSGLTFFFGNSRDLGQSHGLSGLTSFFGGACCFGQPGNFGGLSFFFGEARFFGQPLRFRRATERGPRLGRLEHHARCRVDDRPVRRPGVDRGRLLRLQHREVRQHVGDALGRSGEVCHQRARLGVGSSELDVSDFSAPRDARLGNVIDRGELAQRMDRRDLELRRGALVVRAHQRELFGRRGQK